MTTTFVGEIPATQACELANVTYRQLDYWARRAWVCPSIDLGLGRAGRRLYGPADVVRLGALGHFGQAGLDVGRLGPQLAALDLPLGTDFLISADATGVDVCPAEQLRHQASQARPQVFFDAGPLQARLRQGSKDQNMTVTVRVA